MAGHALPKGEQSQPPVCPLRGGVRRFMSHRLAVVGGIVFILLLLAAFVAPSVWHYSYTEMTPDNSAPPSLAHPFGTDELGHDMLALVLRGTQRSLEIALLISLVSTVLGTLWGTVSGLYRGLLDAVMMRIVDLVLMLPVVALAVVLAQSTSGSWWELGLVLGGLLAPPVARVVRAQVLSLREREFVQAARALGASQLHIIRRHLLPNVAGIVIVSATLAVAAGVLAETSLSFLGFGIHPPDTSLGLLVGNAVDDVGVRPWEFYFPGLFIILIALSVNFIGDGLRDAFDPRQRAHLPGPARRTGGSAAAAAGVARGQWDADVPTEPTSLLSVRNLSVRIPSEDGEVYAVRGLSLDVRAGEILAVVGESGSGKSLTAWAVMGLLPRTARIGGSILLKGEDLLSRSDAELSRIRGAQVTLIPQDPATALNPVYTVGEQVAEALVAHGASRASAWARAVELLGEVGIPNPAERARQYPRQLSGGMCQRVTIAIAIADNPELIIADEPTTALDVTIQAQILDTLVAARDRTGAAMVLITHDLGVVAGVADRVLVMYAGKAVEFGSAQAVLTAPRTPYTAGLLASLPRIDQGREAELIPMPGSPPQLTEVLPGCAFAPRCPLAAEECLVTEPPLRLVSKQHAVACLRTAELERPGHQTLFAPAAQAPSVAPPGLRNGHNPDDAVGVLLDVQDVAKHFRPRSKGWRLGGPAVIQAVRGVSFQLAEGETLGIAGESGCGKTTLSRMMIGLEHQSAGAVRFRGHELSKLSGRMLRAVRLEVQIIFQDTNSSLDPRMTVSEIVAEPLRIHHRYGSDGAGEVHRLLTLVGLGAGFSARFPHQLSGGQRQRVAIARALVLGPRVLILDEPVSALDPSIQAGVLNLLRRLQRQLGLSYIFISHDLAVLRHIADRVAVMHLGQIVELGGTDEIFERPLHPYTQALISAIPIPDPRRERARNRIVLHGELPSPLTPPAGCPFRGRCPKFEQALTDEQRKLCIDVAPALREQTDAHQVACHYSEPEDVL